MKSVLQKHIRSSKHELGKKARSERSAKRAQTWIDGHAYIEQTKSKGSTLSDEVLVFRVNCLKTYMSGGIPLNKLEHFRLLSSNMAYV